MSSLPENTSFANSSLKNVKTKDLNKATQGIYLHEGVEMANPIYWQKIYTFPKHCVC